jgi:prevent-host-death family protein
MATVTIHDAKTNLSELIRRVEAGEEIIIARGKEPVAVLKSYDKAEMARRRRAAFGSMVGKFATPADSALIGPATDEQLVEAFGQQFLDDITPAPETKK